MLLGELILVCVHGREAGTVLCAVEGHAGPGDTLTVLPPPCQPAVLLPYVCGFGDTPQTGHLRMLPPLPCGCSSPAEAESSCC